MLSIDVHVKTVLKNFRWLSIRENSFGACSECDKIVSSYAHCAIKSFPRMLSMASYNFRKLLKNPKSKCKF